MRHTLDKNARSNGLPVLSWTEAMMLVMVKVPFVEAVVVVVVVVGCCCCCCCCCWGWALIIVEMIVDVRFGCDGSEECGTFG